MRRVYDPSAEEWDHFIKSHPQAHILQTSLWGELKQHFNWRVRRVALVEDGRLRAGAQLLLRPLFPRLQHGPSLAYVPKGPLVDWEDPYATAVLLSAIHPVARQERTVCLTIEPELPDVRQLNARLRECTFRPSARSIQPRRTIHVDLRPPEEQVLAAMKSKTRYNIRLAQRHNVEVRAANAEDIATFYRLSQLTARRDEFSIHSHAYYQRVYDLFVPSGLACLLLAEYQGQPLAGLMAFACGRRAWYFYGASSNEERHRMPNYALQWAAMRWAKERGCETYDLWGVPDEEEAVLEREFTERSEGLWGVYRFKRGFGGQVVRYIGTQDYVYRPLFYPLYRRALQWRSRDVQ
jgi:lipid II:glycine glycyltransferase (peptidoglycan interpeptide bridge formation enzyme)